MEPFSLDAEVAAFVARTAAFTPGPARAATLAEHRATYDRMCRAFDAPHPPGLEVRDGSYAAVSPARRIAYRQYRPRDAAAGRAILYFHGGGFVLGGLHSHDSICAELAHGAGAVLVAVDYRLAPEHPYPAALDDAQAAFAALSDAGTRVVVAGDSAGGTLAAALCLRQRRLGGAMPAAQVLIYPALHPDAARAAGTWRESVPMLGAADLVQFRRQYAGGTRHDRTTDPELAPLAAADFSMLPPAAVFAADIDPLAEDSAEYVAALRAAGVPATLHPGSGLVHAYLRGRHQSARVAEAFAAVLAALRGFVRGAA